MNEDRNQHQIIRKDARNCFVESLNDAFKIGKIHLAFATYDLSRPTGQRQTNNIHIYIAVDEFLELCRKLEGGELRYLLKNKKTTGDKNTSLSVLGRNFCREACKIRTFPCRWEKSVQNSTAIGRKQIRFPVCGG